MTVLCVDLDGTLINSNTLHEKVLLFIKQYPLKWLMLFVWIFKGKAYLKQQLAKHVNLAVDQLPYNLELISWIKEEKNKGRKIILVTAADGSIANAIAKYLGIFDGVFASDGKINLKAEKKANLLNQTYGKNNYDYIGNDKADLHVWKDAKHAIFIHPSKNLIKNINKVATLDRYFSLNSLSFKNFFKAIRVHQYTKNLLLFVPLITSHLIFNQYLLVQAMIGFVCFCCAASSVYLLNDLFDLSADRQHPHKSKRAIASGLLSIKHAVYLIATFLFAAILLASKMPVAFVVTLAVYYLMTLLYSLYLKQILLMDIIALSVLYTLRVVAGMTVLPLSLCSLWLLLFSMFIFLSLAFLKRVTDLKLLMAHQQSHAIGRAYTIEQTSALTIFGITSGFLAILILALYLNSNMAISLYHCPQALLMLFPIFIYWLCRIWLLAIDGKVSDDPVLFAVKDKTSFMCGALIIVVMWIAIKL